MVHSSPTHPFARPENNSVRPPSGSVIFCVLLCLALFSLPGSCHAVDVVVDNDNGLPHYTEAGTGWTTCGLASGGNSTLQTSDTTTTMGGLECGGYNGGSYRTSQSAGATASWAPDAPFATVYNVSAVFRSGTDRPERVLYAIRHVTGMTTVGISQRGNGDLVEVPLGCYSFPAESGSTYSVQMTVPEGGAPCVADAILLRMGSPADDPPVITALVRTPAVITSTTAVSVRALVSDDVSVTSAAVSYRVSPGGVEQTVQAFDDGGHGDGDGGDSIYGATIPPSADGTSITLFFRAWDNQHQEGRSQPRNYYVSRAPSQEIRAIWADAFKAGFHNQAEADDLITTCRAANINVVMPEVRTRGHVWFQSAIEPLAASVAPGFDPLEYITRIAHDTSGGQKRIQVHAWLVMNNVGGGRNRAFLPTSHVLSLHPEYAMLSRDSAAGNSGYVDPGHPGVVDYNLALILECVSKYDIDGYHFDFIRYPESAGMWGYNPVSVARFNAVYGRNGTPDDWDPLWQAWRRECVTLMVKKIYVKAWKLKPHVLLTAATVNWGWGYDQFTSSSAYNQAFQDWSGWLQHGLLDYNSLMSYAPLSDPARYQGWSSRSLADDHRRGSIIGAGVYMSTNIQGSMDELLFARSSGAAGLNIYDWGSEVRGSTTSETRAQFYTALREQVFPTWVDPPSPAWRSRPTAGIFEGQVTLAGQPVDHARVRIAGSPETETVTDGSGWYAIMDVPPGAHEVEFMKSSAGIEKRLVSSRIPQAGEIVTLNAALDVTMKSR
jgi:uncharacterized lipoprotein YddW (UPF0748 family)